MTCELFAELLDVGRGLGFPFCSPWCSTSGTVWMPLTSAVIVDDACSTTSPFTPSSTGRSSAGDLQTLFHPRRTDTRATLTAVQALRRMAQHQSPGCLQADLR